MIVLLDNGHGQETAGKRSPDGRLLEYAYTREIASRVAQILSNSVPVKLITPELSDITLDERCERVNAYGTDAILVSIHVNAAGLGDMWRTGRGWEAWTSVGQTKADKLATCLYEAAEEVLTRMKVRKDMSDGDPDKEGHLYILKHTVCPAVLTENLFQDNKEDVTFLLSPEGKAAITALHVQGITNYLAHYSK